MLEMIETGAENVIGYRIDGKIEGRELDRFALVVEERLKSHPRLRIYAEVVSLGGMSLEAFLKDVRLKVRHFRDFEREAVVTDATWLATFVKVGDKIFPSIEARHFPFEKRAEALEWVCG